MEDEVTFTTVGCDLFGEVENVEGTPIPTYALEVVSMGFRTPLENLLGAF